MWHCPKCGEQIDAGFDVCWNCGTARDGTAAAGFHAEPDDPAVPDPGPEPDEPKETAEDQTTPLGMAGQRIVELCSAGDVVEADDLCELLEEAGIQARIVGEVLGNAGGGLPLGEATAPRIWVLEDDAIRGREVIDRWRDELEEGPIAWPESDAPPEWETPAEEDEGPLPSDVRFRFLSQGFWIAGGLCIVIGGLWAWQNWLTLSQHPATADGWLIGIYWRDLDKTDRTDAATPTSSTTRNTMPIQRASGTPRSRHPSTTIRVIRRNTSLGQSRRPGWSWPLPWRSGCSCLLWDTSSADY